MHRIGSTVAAFFAALSVFSAVARDEAVSRHETRKLARGWEFKLADASDWQKVEVPHDWAIAGPFDPLGEGETGKLPWKGRGTYRLTLESPGELRPGWTNELVFEGVMARSRVVFNGRELGGSDYGYMGYRVDLTPFIKPGNNELRVEVDTLDHRSRWYPGAGIYRRVLLEQSFGPRVLPDTMAIVAGEISPAAAVVNVSCETTLGPTNFSFRVENPRLWDVADAEPKLYTLEFMGQRFRYGIRSFEFTVDRGFMLNGRRVEIRGACLHSDLGILGMAFNRSAMRRQLARMKEMGFNAVRTSHNCPSPELLELCDEMGLLVWNECFDKWDSTAGRRPEQNLEEYVAKYLERFVRRDRNHPSVIVWSIGNEIDSMTSDPQSKDGTTRERCRLFRETVRRFDKTRPVSIASCAWYDAVVAGCEYDDLDLVGWNYSTRYAFYRAKRPSQPVIESESASCIASSGFYADAWPTSKYDLAVSAREVDASGRNCPGWGDPPDRDFERMQRDLYCAGQFVWTGCDYLGENWPYCRGTERYGINISSNEYARSSYFGVCDLLCLPKDSYWNYRAEWRDDVPTLQLSPMHWTFPGREGKVRPVQAYSSYDTVELFVNGKSYGRRTKDKSAKSYAPRFWGDDCEDPEGYYKVLSRYRLLWPEVVYEPGEIMAVAYDSAGRPVMTNVLRTAGAPVRVCLEPESNELPGDGETYVFVKVTTLDADGTFVPGNCGRVTFRLEGPGEIVSVGNANARGHESFKQTGGHSLYYGVAGLFLRRFEGAEGAIRLTASCEGLAPAQIELR